MKRQFLMGKSGFTLFELMIVIAILAIFFSVTMGMNWNPRSESEKADLIAVSIGGQLRTEVQNIAIGKMPKRDGNIAKMTTIAIGTGGLLTKYMSGTVELGSSNFSEPFFEGDMKYQIYSVTWTGSASPHLGDGIIVIEPSGISFSGAAAGIADNIYLEIKVKYGHATRKLTLDRRTGKITEKKY